MNKIVYTAIIGKGYKLNEPICPNPTWEFLCFTDQNFKSENWEIIKIDNFFDKRKMSRKIKIANHNIFDYDLCVYLDSRFTVKRNLDEFVKNNLDTDLAVMKKKIRDCAYDEANFCMKIGKDSKEVLQSQIQKYSKEGFPRHFGLYAPGIMIKRNTESVRNFMNLWYAEVEEFSYRDILSFAYTLWKNPIELSVMPYKKTYSSFMFKGDRK